MILPGLLCDSRMFVGQLDAFPAAFVVDGFYPGCTELTGMAGHALAQAPERFALLGHSMGARVALEIVRQAPHRVSRLMLADTGVHTVRAGEADKRYALLELGRASGMAALVDAWLPPMLSAAGRADSTLSVALRAMCVDAGLEAYARQIEALLGRPAVADMLGRIACPTFCIVGSDDAWSPVEQHRAIVEAIPGAQLRIIPGAGHMAPAEAPEEFNHAIREWLAWPASGEP